MAGNEIVAVRVKPGHAQPQFAARIHSRQSTVALWEMGKYEPVLVYRRILKELAEKTDGAMNKARTK